MRNTKKNQKIEVSDEQQSIQPENTTPQGYIFDSITYYTDNDLDNFVVNMNKEQAIYCLLQACQSAFKRKAYTLTESEVLSKALRILTQN